MILFLILKFLSVTVVSGEECEISCSNFVDQVCGMETALDGTITVSRYLNICHLNKIKCRLKDTADVQQIADEECHIKKHDLRRVFDFGIVGAHQACNHTCPTYCADTYEPVCAQIWKRGTNRYNTRTMVNHCHVDLLSCSIGVNVTITPLGKCFVNPAGLLFMSQMAAMKSLGFLDGNRRSLSMTQWDKTTDSGENVDVESDSGWDVRHIYRRMLNSVLLKRLIGL